MGQGAKWRRPSSVLVLYLYCTYKYSFTSTYSYTHGSAIISRLAEGVCEGFETT